MTEENKNEELAVAGMDLSSIKDQLKSQILQEMKSEQAVAMEESSIRRKEEKAEHARYIATMKKSPDPWVDIIGWVHTNEGVKIELEWNDAFIDYLRAAGIAGTDEEQVVQKWVTLLLRDMADQMEDRHSQDSEYG